MSIKMVIFDLDGVLVDACEWHRIALNESLKKLCHYQINIEDHIKTFNGIPTRKKLDILINRGVIKPEIKEKVYDLKQKKTIDIINQLATKRSEKIEMIQYLKSNGILVGCFTNSIRQTATLMLKKTGIYELFDVIVTNQDVEHPKPSPQGYNKIINMFNLDKKSVIIVEDSPKGIESAIKSGCTVIAVNNPDNVNIDLFK